MLAAAQPLPADAGAAELRLIGLRGLPEFRPGDDIGMAILEAAARTGTPLADNDVVVVAQKIVSKVEDRYVALETIAPGPAAQEIARETGKPPRLVQAILNEARAVLRTRPGVIVVEDLRGFVLANAGLDASNVGPAGHLLALPEDPDRSAAAIRASIIRQAGIDVAVVVNDSWGRPFRLGTVGCAIGVAGLDPLQDRCGDRDRDGRVLEATLVAVADEVSAAASLIMGPGAEGRPVVIVRGVPRGSDHRTGKTLLRDPSIDMFREERR